MTWSLREFIILFCKFSTAFGSERPCRSRRYKSEREEVRNVLKVREILCYKFEVWAACSAGEKDMISGETVFIFNQENSALRQLRD